MTTTLVSFRIPTDLKIKSQKAADKLGIPLSAIVNNYLKEFAETSYVEFGAEQLSDKAKKRYDKIISDALKGKNVSRTYATVDEMMQDLMQGK